MLYPLVKLFSTDNMRFNLTAWSPRTSRPKAHPEQIPSIQPKVQEIRNRLDLPPRLRIDLHRDHAAFAIRVNAFPADIEVRCNAQIDKWHGRGAELAWEGDSNSSKVRRFVHVQRGDGLESLLNQSVSSGVVEDVEWKIVLVWQRDDAQRTK